ARLRTLAGLSHLVTSSLDTDHVLASIARAAVQLMDAPYVGFWVADETAGLLHLRACSDDEPDASFRGPLRFGEGVVGGVARERRPLDIPDIFADARFVGREWARSRGFRSCRAIPLLDHERLLGVLVLIAPRPIQVDADDEDLLRSFSAQAAAAIRNARLYEETRRHAERLAALESVNRLLSSSLDAQEVLQTLARALAQLFDAGYVSLWTRDHETGRLRRAFALGDAELARSLRDEMALGEGAVGWVAQHGVPIIGVDAAADPRLPTPHVLLERGLRWATIYPIAAGERVLGAFVLVRAAPGPGRAESESLMASLAAQAAVALDNARLYAETARRLSETRALLEVAELLNSTLDSRTLLREVTVTIARVCQVDRCTLELWDGEDVVPLMSQFADGRRVPDLWARFQSMSAGRPLDVPANRHVVETRQPLVIEDTAATTLLPREWIEAFGLRACLIVPLLRKEQVIGIMTLDYAERARPFAPWQRDLAMAIGGQLAFALENTRLYAEAQARLRETVTLLAVGRVLSQPGPPAELMPRVAAEIGRAFGADTVGVYLLDVRRRVLVPAGGYHVPKDLLAFFRDRPIPLDTSPDIAAAMREHRPLATADAHRAAIDPEWESALPRHSLLFVPTMAHGEAVGGIFLVWWGAGRIAPPAQVRLLEGVSAQVGLAIENADLARRTQARLEETERLLAVSRVLSSTLDVEGLVRHFLRHVAAIIDADSVGMWTIDEDGRTLLPLLGYHLPPEHVPALREMRLSLDEAPFYAEAARTLRPVFAVDARQDHRIPALMRERVPHRAQLFVPMVTKDRMRGGFSIVWWARTPDLPEGDIALLEAIASQAGAAFENARLFEENRRRVEELSALHDLARAVTGELDRRALLEALRAHIARVLDARNLAVVLRDDERGDLEVALQVADGAVVEPEPRRYPGAGVGLMSLVFERGRPLRSRDHAGDCARHGLVPVEPAGMRYWIGAPLTARDRVLGALVLRSAERAFTEADERLLFNIAHLGALALSSVRLYEERARAYAELAAAQDELVRTEKLRALGEMASGVAHDFNNLLASILGRAQLLLRRVEEPRQRQWLQVIERAALDGAQTVRRLQEFTRIRRDQPRVPVDLVDVVREALDMTQMRWRGEAQARGARLEVRTSLAPVPAVPGDPAELREAMTNLILNAADAMPHGGTLTLATGTAGDRVEVTVADTGHGMTAEVRARIFDPFFTTKGPQGTGLGLSMTYGIVARHGGTITVESEPGRGATFRLSFPAGSEPAPAPPALAPAAGPPPRALRCLVVDDEPEVGGTLADILAAAGHEVVLVDGGASAIARFRAETFDLVITDLAMPGVSGWQVAQACKERAPGVPVFLVTGLGVELSEAERAAHGVDAVLVKPLQLQQVLDAVAEVARSRPVERAEP
ncbi:MAG TPA: GAF domain-containing protein, partial [Candidatus Tectomicrobia bacterium]|nr:GAF domain-containing protein [Candidatus Tectomicrobia bacterium]